MARADTIPENRQPTFMALASTPETATRAETALAVSPLMGFIQRPPLLRVSVKSQLQSAPRGVPTSATRQPDASLVPPAWFCTTSTVYSSSRLQACCILLPDLGFTAFRGFRRPKTRESRGGRCSLPAARGPYEVSPRRLPYRVTAALALLWLLLAFGRCSRGRTHSTSHLKAGLGVAISSPVARLPVGRGLHREARFRAFLNRRVCGVQLAMKRYLHAKSFHGFRSPSRCTPRRSLRDRSPRYRGSAPCGPPKRALGEASRAVYARAASAIPLGFAAAPSPKRRPEPLPGVYPRSEGVRAWPSQAGRPA